MYTVYIVVPFSEDPIRSMYDLPPVSPSSYAHHARTLYYLLFTTYSLLLTLYYLLFTTYSLLLTLYRRS